MDIEQVRQFVEVMRTGSVSAAAKSLHISQPALSRSIRRLESELGGPLFERTSNSIAPNEQARVALSDAEELVSVARRLRDDVAASRVRSRMLRIGTCAPAPLWYLTTYLVSIIPGTMLGQEMMDEDELERRLYENSVDLAIANRAVAGMACRPLMRENLYVSAPVEHPFARRDSMSFADLGHETFILYGQIGFWEDVHRRMMPDATFIRQDDREVFLQLMRTTHALGFASDAPVIARPRIADATDEPRVERVNVPLTDPEAHATFYLAARPDRLQGDGPVATLMREVPLPDGSRPQ